MLTYLIVLIARSDIFDSSDRYESCQSYNSNDMFQIAPMFDSLNIQSSSESIASSYPSFISRRFDSYVNAESLPVLTHLKVLSLEDIPLVIFRTVLPALTVLTYISDLTLFILLTFPFSYLGATTRL